MSTNTFLVVKDFVHLNQLVEQFYLGQFLGPCKDSKIWLLNSERMATTRGCSVLYKFHLPRKTAQSVVNHYHLVFELMLNYVSGIPLENQKYIMIDINDDIE